MISVALVRPACFSGSVRTRLWKRIGRPAAGPGLGLVRDRSGVTHGRASCVQVQQTPCQPDRPGMPRNPFIVRPVRERRQKELRSPPRRGARFSVRSSCRSRIERLVRVDSRGTHLAPLLLGRSSAAEAIPREVPLSDAER